MASFVEQAVLKLKDESSPQIRKINAELKKLFATANSLKSKSVDLKISDKGVNKAIADIAKLKTALAGLKGAHPISVTANVSGAARQLAQLRQQAQRPLTIATRAGAAARATPPTGRFAPGAAAAAVGLTAHNALSTVGRAAREGINQSDIGDFTLALKATSEHQGRWAQAAVSRLQQEQLAEPGGAMISRGLMAQLVSESLGTTRGDIPAAKHLAGEAASIAKMQVAMGLGLDEATEGAFRFGKAFEAMGWITDKEGKYDPTRATEAYDFLRQMGPTIGKEMTGPFVQQMAKYLRATRFTVTKEGFATALLLGEEMGTSAAVGMNQAVKQLSGKGITTPTLNAQLEYGLTSIKQQAAGTVGKAKKTKPVVDKPTDEAGLRKDPLVWLATHGVAAMKRKGLDPDDPLDIAKFAGQVTSDRTATEFVIAAMVRRDELLAQRAEAFARTGTKEEQRAAIAGSTRIRAIGMQQQFQSILGESFAKAEPIIIPAMKFFGDAMAKTATAIREGDWATALTEGAKAAAPPIAGVGALGGAALLMPVLSKALGFMAPALSLQAMASSHPGVQALGGAAAALSGSASNLNSAAAALSGAAAKQSGANWLGQLGAGIMLAPDPRLRAIGFALTALSAIPIPELKTEQQSALAEAKKRFEAKDQELKDLMSGGLVIDRSTGSAMKDSMDAVKRIAEKREALITDMEKIQKEIQQLVNSAIPRTDYDIKQPGGVKVDTVTANNLLFKPTGAFEPFHVPLPGAKLPDGRTAPGKPVMPRAAPKAVAQARAEEARKERERTEWKEEKVDKRGRVIKTDFKPTPFINQLRQALETAPEIDLSKFNLGIKSAEGMLINAGTPIITAAGEIKTAAAFVKEYGDKATETSTALAAAAAATDTPLTATAAALAATNASLTATDTALATTSTALTTAGTALTATNTALTATSSALTQTNTALTTTSSSLTQSVASLQSVPSLFATTFSTGATAIGNAGTIAGNALAGMAPGIGQTIGATAGAAIQAAVSGLNVNVNINQSGGADKGGQAVGAGGG